MNDSVPTSFFADIQARAEPFRHECEVRWIAGFETNAKREVYLEGVWDKRGEAVAKRLRADVWEFMKQAGLAVVPRQEALFG